MNESAVIERVLALCPDAQHVTTDGDTYFFCGEDRMMPFATLVTRDDHDAAPASDLARVGVYRLNIGVRKQTYTGLFGAPPAPNREWSVVETGHDYRQLDRLMPHPTYSPMAWVCVLNPSEETFARIEPLLVEAYENAAPKAEARLAKQRSLAGIDPETQ
jgi:hypothetical protein